MKKMLLLKLEIADSPVNHKKLLLCGNEVHLLNPILKETISSEETVDSLDLKVTFFSGSRFSQTICCKTIYSNENLFENQADLFNSIRLENNVLGKVFIAMGVKNDTELLIKNTSWFMRNSETLSSQDIIELPNEWRIIDGRGMALWGKLDNFEQQSKREIFLVMLGLAYYKALQQINQELANMLLNSNKIEDLDKLYKEAAEFNACYYFHNPIEFSRYPTFKAWQDIRTAYCLQEKNQEVTSQLTKVHQILSYTQQKQENRMSEKRNWWLAVFGIFLSLLGLIEVIDIVKNWLGFWGYFR